jgi:aspartate/methionine/tyrosine aminotransferase
VSSPAAGILTAERAFLGRNPTQPLTQPAADDGGPASRDEQAIDLTSADAQLLPAVSLPVDIYRRLAAVDRRSLEQAFLDRYGAVAGEFIGPDETVFFLTASLAITAVARHLVHQGVRRIGVLEPAFPHLPRLLREAGLELVSVPEDDDALLAAVDTLGAMFLVLPNNPTGWAPSARALAALPAAAKASGCCVVLDRSCRFHQDRQYSRLFQPDYDWIDIQDTGKTWSTAGTKLAFVRSSLPGTVEALRHDFGYAPAVPPLNLYVASEAVVLEGGDYRVRRTVARNREVLEAALGELGFSIVSRPLGVALMCLPRSYPIGSTSLAQSLRAANITVVPGRDLFWHTPHEGEAYIRVSLIRPNDVFTTDIEALATAIRSTGAFTEQSPIPSTSHQASRLGTK